MGDKTPDARARTYGDVMREAALARERDNTLRNIEAKRRAEAEAAAAGAAPAPGAGAAGAAAAAPAAAAPSAAAAAAGPAGQKRNRWDAGAADAGAEA